MNEPSDMEIFGAMLNRAGVVHKIEGDQENMIVIKAQSGPKNKGYGWFFAEFIFDEAGSLEHVGIWE